MDVHKNKEPALPGFAARVRSVLFIAAFFSMWVNILMLTVPIYMLQVFDRVLSSRSIDTLLLLSMIALAALTTLGVLEAVRGLVLGRLGCWIERTLGGQIIWASVTTPIGTDGRSIQGLRDLGTIRAFLSGPGIVPLFDFPWTLLFLAVIFLLHPMLGAVATGGAVVLGTLAIAHELCTRRPLVRAAASSVLTTQQAEAAVQNADAVRAMGMLPALVQRLQDHGSEPYAQNLRAARRSAIIGGSAKFLRSALQMGILGIGAALVVRGSLTAGGMIAASILMGRALAPIEMAISSWRSAVMAHTAYRRVRRQLSNCPARGQTIKLPDPEGRIVFDKVTFAFPEQTEPMLRGVCFELDPGDSLAIVGPTAAGKTTLARLLVGNLMPRFGTVRLDGADLCQWSGDQRNRHIGYMPQDIELFSGTVQENIARMKDGYDGVIEAARLIGAHEMILLLPQGYETQIGIAGASLSGGQRQWIALARAVYGEPRLVVLDEPNASLGQHGEAGLVNAIRTLKQRGTTVVLITHRPQLLRQVDKILVLHKGRAQLFGTRQDVLPRLIAPAAAAPAKIAAHA